MKTTFVKFSPKEGLEMALEDHFDQGLRLSNVYFDKKGGYCLVVDDNNLLDVPDHDEEVKKIIAANPEQYVMVPQSYRETEINLMWEFACEYECEKLCPSKFRNRISEFKWRVRDFGLEGEWLNFRYEYYLDKVKKWCERNGLNIEDFL